MLPSEASKEIIGTKGSDERSRDTRRRKVTPIDIYTPSVVVVPPWDAAAVLCRDKIDTSVSLFSYFFVRTHRFHSRKSERAIKRQREGVGRGQTAPCEGRTWVDGHAQR